MSEPARHSPLHETAGRPAPGPLRDWLAAMKAHTPAAGQPEIQAEPRAARPEPARAAEPAWSPRLVQPAEAPRPAPEAEDVSELMAENLMLKAKLRVESERYGDLQAILAQEIRDLRQHVRNEMESLHQVRAERDQLCAARDEARAELGETRAELNEALADRDLWQARAEALAQPLFQKR